METADRMEENAHTDVISFPTSPLLHKPHQLHELLLRQAPMASPILRFRKLCYVEPLKSPSSFREPRTDAAAAERPPKKEEEERKERQAKKWRCIDSCYWSIGCFCAAYWLLLFLFHCLPPTMTFPGFPVTELPGARLKREEGLAALHPVVMVPGIITGGLELWEGKPCAEGLFRKRLWGGGFTEILKRPLCWLEHMSLDNETGLDPPGIRVRAVPSLVAADYFAPGYFVWAVLIQNLAKIGYEEKNLHMAAYDWRLSFQNTEVRDYALSRLKSQIELMYLTNGNKRVVVVPHSMGVLYFLHFLKWVEAPPPMGGGGGPTWCAKHIKAVMNIAPAFLGVPKGVATIISHEGKDTATIRAMARGMLDSEIYGLQTLEHFLRVCRTWDSVVSLIPKGGEAIWGDLDWSPEEGFRCGLETARSPGSPIAAKNTNNSKGRVSYAVKEHPKYGRMVSFGKSASHIPSSRLTALDPKELSCGSDSSELSPKCQVVWTEYDEISREDIRKVADNKAYTSRTILDLFRVLAPRLMKRGEAHFSHGIADDLDDPKYNDYKYWSNPLEMKLPDAPEMEIYALYGVGIPTERSYIYKTSATLRCKSTPFRIDTSAEGDDGEDCLSGGIHFVDGDGSVPVISSGFMCAKGWRGKTRFNPSGSPTYIREYRHKAPASLLEGRGLESGAHVDIMGNVALIEDVLRVAAGASGEEIGGDRIYSDILKISERIDLQL